MNEIQRPPFELAIVSVLLGLILGLMINFTGTVNKAISAGILTCEPRPHE